MSEGPIIPKDASEEEKRALRHSGGHGPDPTGPNTGGDYNLPKHKPFKPDKGYTGHGEGVGDRLTSKKK